MKKENQNIQSALEKEPSFSAAKNGREKPASAEKKDQGREPDEDNLKDQVGLARLRYARRHYEVNNAFSRLRSIFGKDLKTDPKEIGRTDATYESYKKSLNDLKNYELSKISEDASLAPDKRRVEMGNLIRFFSLDEKINLYSAHGQAKAEAFEKKFGKFPGWFAKRGADFTDWYRRQNWKWKMAGGFAMGAVGLGAVSRIVSGAAMGTGVTAVMEARHRKKEQLLSREKNEKILENLGHIESPEEKMKSLSSWIEKDIENLDNDLKKEKRQALYRKSVGITVGILIGSGAVAHAVRGTLDYLGITGNLSEGPHSAPSHVAPEIPTTDHVAPEMPHNIELSIPKGSSFEGELIKHLENTGVDHKEAGKMAHRMYLEYLQNHPDPATHDYSLIQPGARVELSPDGTHITGFHASPEPQIPPANIKQNIAPSPESLNVSEESHISPEKFIESQNNITQAELEAEKIARLWEKSFDVMESVALGSAGAYALHKLGFTKFIEGKINELKKKKDQPVAKPEDKKVKEEKIEEKQKEKKEEFSEFNGRLKNLAMNCDRIRKIEKEYPDIKKENFLKNIQKELEKLDIKIVSSSKKISRFERVKSKDYKIHSEAERNKLEKLAGLALEAQKKLGRAEELFRLQEEYDSDFKRAVFYLFKTAYGGKKPADLEKIDAAEFLKENKNNQIGKLYLRYCKTLGEKTIRPRKNETMRSWNVRFLAAVFKSEGIVYNMTKVKKTE